MHSKTRRVSRRLHYIFTSILADSCEYGYIKEEMICDCLIVGIRDESLSERLQMESDLTLEKAKKIIRQREAVQQQQGILKGSTKTLETVTKSKARNKMGKAQKKATSLTQPMTRQHIPGKLLHNAEMCRRCRKSSHSWQLCPAKVTTCFCCNRKSHYGSHCLSKQWLR